MSRVNATTPNDDDEGRTMELEPIVEDPDYMKRDYSLVVPLNIPSKSTHEISIDISKYIIAAHEDISRGSTYDFDITHCVIDSVHQKGRVNGCPFPIMGISTLPQFNKLMCCDAVHPDKINSASKSDVCRAAFYMPVGNTDAEVIYMETDPARSVEKENYLQKFGDMSRDSMKSSAVCVRRAKDPLSTNLYRLNASRIEDVFSRNLAKGRLDSRWTAGEGSIQLFTEFDVNRVVDHIVEAKNKALETHDITDFNIRICRADGLTFDDVTGTPYQQSARSLSSVQPLWPVTFTLVFTLRLFHRQRSALSIENDIKTSVGSGGSPVSRGKKKSTKS